MLRNRPPGHTNTAPRPLRSLPPVFSEASVSICRRPSCAVNMSRNSGIPKVLGVRPDQLDHQVEFTGAVGVARITLRLIRRDELGCVEAVQTMNALGVAVLHQEHRARPKARPRELDQLAQARW